MHALLRTSLALVACACVLAAPRARARAGSDEAPSTAAAASTADRDAFHLGRAVERWSARDLRGAREHLEQIDVSTTSSFAEADRAAFLLAVVCLRLGDDDAFERAAARGGDPAGTPYRRWIALLAAAHGPDADVPGTMDIVRDYLRARARDDAGEDAAADWKRVADHDARDRLEADLVGAALVRLAARRLESGGDAVDLLERVPDGSRYAPRALHIRGLLAAEAGDTASARRILSSLQTHTPNYAGRRDVKLALGGLAMERGHWYAALRCFESAEDDWLDEVTQLSRLQDDAQVDEVWRAWGRPGAWNDEIRLSPGALDERAFALADAAADLRRDVPDAPGDDDVRGMWPQRDTDDGIAPWDTAGVLEQNTPDADEWDRVRAARAARADADNALAEQERVVQRRRAELERRADYLERGRARASESVSVLTDAAATLARLVARRDDAVARLEAVRADALSRVERRARGMRDEIERNVLFMSALRHFHVDGPNRDRLGVFPDGVPSTAQVLAEEDSLARELDACLARFAASSADAINRSFDSVWLPTLSSDARTLQRSVLAELDRARRIGDGLDSALVAVDHDPLLAGAIARRDELGATADSLRAVETNLRRRIAVAVAERGRARLDLEREAIDYHMADVAYELAVAAAADSTGMEDIERDRATTRLETFLLRYPGSIARGECRFRLADLLLSRARDDFQVRMAEFLGEEPSSDDISNRALAPFVDYAPAADLYRAILAEDADFPHTDAVLFNLGMILSDDGQADAAETCLARLVTDYPQSPNAQEAWLRMGNDRFDRRDYADAVPCFEHALEGDNASFTAIALYKLGWAGFERDRFDEATGAFLRLMDLYDAHTDLAASMDLRGEAEEYLVHSLARSGGADAFRACFDRAGPRAYESRVLLSLGHLMRSVSLYEDAVACDRLWLERYPARAEALDVSENLVDTYRRWNRPDDARESKLALAPRFLPKGEWFDANEDGSLRARALDFARAAYRENAAWHHRRAKETGDLASWRAALSSYDDYLAHWSDADDAARIHFAAGDAAAALDDYAVALTHFTAAAAGGSPDLARDASWQRVAVCDEWYRTTCPRADVRGDESLARQLARAGDDFVARFPGDERASDVAWRQSNIAYAHGWYEDAAARLDAMARAWPDDDRAPTAVRMGGDARYRLNDFDGAGAAYERALVLARAAGADSTATALETTIPLCYYKHAESVADADGRHGDATAAPLFADVARRWPTFAEADLALYRAGLGFAALGHDTDAVDAWEELLRAHPESDYARDASVQVASVLEQSGDATGAARAYERFSRLYPGDDDAADALLKSADLLAAAGDTAGAEATRTSFLARFPAEVDAVMSIRAGRATRELESVAAGTTTLSSLRTPDATSDLSAYLALAEEHPDMAAPSILARVDYLDAEEAFPDYAAIRLTQPLPAAIERKKAALESLIARYDRCTRHGVTEYSRASAYRIGAALIEFGDALAASERPQGLGDDDLLAYEDVLNEQAWGFYDRGEDVWSELLRHRDGDDPGGWVSRTQGSLWPRLAQRFLYRPAVDYPLVAASPPAAQTAD